MAEQTDDLRQEIENNLAILREGLGVQETAGLVTESGESARALRERQLQRAVNRLRQLVEERNPGGARAVDWTDLALVARDRLQKPGSPPREHFEDDAQYAEDWNRHERVPTPGSGRPWSRHSEGEFKTPSEGSGPESVTNFGTAWKRSSIGAPEEATQRPLIEWDRPSVKRTMAGLEQALAPLRKQDSKPPDERAKAIRESAAKKALEK